MNPGATSDDHSLPPLAGTVGAVGSAIAGNGNNTGPGASQTILPAPPLSSGHSSPQSVSGLETGKGKFSARQFTPSNNSTGTTPKRARTAEAEANTSGTDDKPKRIACIECRQQKVRCDAHELYPESCTRCVKKNLKCLLKPDFKRTYKRRRLAEVEQEIERLRQSMDGQESEKRRIVSGSLLDLSTSSYPSNALPRDPEKPFTPQYTDLPAPNGNRERPATATAPRETITTPTSVDSTHVDQFHTPPGAGSSSSAQYYRHRPGAATRSGHVELDPSILECTEKTMEGVTLRPETIANLYKEYVAKYHPFLPVVDVSRGPEKIYELCPSLFWTIMSIASRRYDKDGELMMELTPLLKICLSEITISPINRFVSTDNKSPVLNVASAYTVQAFLIYTMWPSITSTLTADSSWSTAGIAMYSGIRVGLHCPGYARDFGRINYTNPIYPKISEQVRTWICCNIVSQTVATVYGFPAFTSFDATVLSACENDSGIDVPVTIKQLMQIQHLEEEVAKTLNSNPKDPLGLSELSERLSLIQILSRKMDELEMRLNPDLDDCRKLVMLGARVHLLTYYFLDNGGYSDLQLQKGMVHVYNSALALLEHAERAYQRDRSFFRYMPGIYTQLLWQSSCIICKVYHSPFGQYVDSNAGRQMYMSCVSLMSKASILKHDMMYRAAEIMQQVWRLFGALSRRNQQQTPQSSRIVIRTRMSASVFFDVLWTLREEIGIRSVAPAVLDQRNPADADDDEGDIDTQSFETTPVNTGVGTSGTALDAEPQLGETQPFRYKDDTEMDGSDAQVHATLTTLPYDPAPIMAGPKPTARGGGTARGRGRGRGRGSKKQAGETRKTASTSASASSPSLMLPPGVSHENGVPTTTAFPAPSSPLATTTTLGSDLHHPASTTGFDPSISVTQPHAHQTPAQGKPGHPDSVVNGVDFFSWEADNIWRDVDMLMNDFGFREDEAPSLDLLYGSAGGSANGSGANSVGHGNGGASGEETPKVTKRF